jgi:hypothetical protein
MESQELATSSERKRQLKFELRINNPPTFYLDKKKKAIDPKTNQPRVDKYYLTGNIFYGEQVHFSIRTKVVNYAKTVLRPYFDNANIPKLTNVKLSLFFLYSESRSDLDNLDSFWKKVILDLMKAVTPKIQERAKKYRTELIHLGIIKDDNSKYVNEFQSKFIPRGNQLVIILEGDPDAVQTSMQSIFDQPF